MDRNRAIAVIEQILGSCGFCKSIVLLLDPTDCSKIECKIKIDADSSQRSDMFQACVEKIVRENGLAIRKTDASLIIYKP